jgi:hypothetical protein
MVYVYPAFDPRYYSMYLQGLYELFGRNHIRFTSRDFPDFGYDCLAIRIGEGRGTRVYIHANDMPEIDPAGLRWCDVFGKVNLDRNLVPIEHQDTVLPIGPTFPVRLWGPVRTTVKAWRNYYLAPAQSCLPLIKHLGAYRALNASRFPIEAYRPSISRADYIYFNAAIWEREKIANDIHRDAFNDHV